MHNLSHTFMPTTLVRMLRIMFSLCHAFCHSLAPPHTFTPRSRPMPLLRTLTCSNTHDPMFATLTCPFMSIFMPTPSHQCCLPLVAPRHTTQLPSPLATAVPLRRRTP